VSAVFSTRLPWSTPETALAALARGRAARGELIDLTESNPTTVGLPYPAAGIRDALARAESARYAPAALGLPAARAAVAAEYARAGVRIDPARVVITASSSESYAHLFKLLADPGDAVLVPAPSYPLFEYLAPLEGVAVVPYRLAFDGVWHLDFEAVESALAEARRRAGRPRAIVVVSPNNPTGSFLKRDELARLVDLAARTDLAVISDEVFAAYPFAPDATRVEIVAADAAAADLAGGARVPLYSLGGLSKSCGLPQLKLGWIVAGGAEVEASLAALELVADTYLSVGTPVQAALGDLFRLGAGIRGAIAARVAENRARLAAALPPGSPCSILPAEAGWSAILRLPATRTDEAWAAALVEREGVLVHPGYLFGFGPGAYLVVSLLPPADAFGAAIGRLFALAGASAR
jgi:aspartate/methionine/tyrosine aminotransferase